MCHGSQSELPRLQHLPLTEHPSTHWMCLVDIPHKSFATSSWTACHGYRHALTCPATVPSGGWVRVGAHRDRWCLWISPCALPNHRCHLGTCSPLHLVPLSQPESPFRQGAGENRSHSEHSPARFGTPRRATRQAVTMRNGSFCRSCHT